MRERLSLWGAQESLLEKDITFHVFRSRKGAWMSVVKLGK